MPQWPHDDLASKVAFFGDPRKSDFQSKYMTTIAPPFQMYYDKHPLKGINVNKKVATSLLRVFTDIFDQCGHDQKKIDAIGLSAYGGCYNFRPVRGSSNLSNHAFAAAIDLDPERNPLRGKSRWNPIVVNAFKKEGWLWGGDYKGRKDPMHFEAVSR
jgi:hypothetical protein